MKNEDLFSANLGVFGASAIGFSFRTASMTGSGRPSTTRPKPLSKSRPERMWIEAVTQFRKEPKDIDDAEGAA